MLGLTLSILLQATAMGAGGQDYATAYQVTSETGRPLVVLIGADWCPGCQTMKNSSIPEVQRRGGLSRVSFAYVNSDRERDLAGKLMRGNSIPQLVVFNRTETGWRRQQLTGAQSPSAIQALLDQAADASELNSTKLSRSE